MSNTNSSIRSVCVYCGSQPGNSPQFKQAAETIGKSIAENKLKLVYGGGTRGIMGMVAKSVIDNGGHVTGIIPTFLLEKEASKKSLKSLTETIVTDNMHQRKTEMFERADAFITLPGGIGTLEELVEMMTWAQLGRHNKPIAIANIDNFWDPLQELIKHMSEQGFIHTQHKVQPLIIDNAEDVIPKLLSFNK